MNNFPTPTETALAVVTNPTAFHDQPAVLATAWEQLMHSRGKIVNLDRLGPPAHQVIPDMIYPSHIIKDDQQSRIAQLTRQIAERKGYPTGGDAA